MATAATTTTAAAAAVGSAADMSHMFYLVVALELVLALALAAELWGLLRLLAAAGGSRSRCPALLAVGVAGAVLACFFGVLPNSIDHKLNRVGAAQHQTASREASELHASLFVADLHSDSLLWQRDLLVRNEHGHVDVPRMLAGNVALQGFTIVSSVPIGINFLSNPRPSLLTDSVTLLAAGSRWDAASILGFSTARVLYQTEKLHSLAARSRGRLSIVATKQQLEAYLARREREPAITAGFLGIEGAHCVGADILNVDVFANAGVRMLGVAHFFDNDLGGSSSGLKKIGLTEYGKQVVERAQRKGMFIDVAHASPATIDDVVRLASRPVINSHTGFQGQCNSPRNLDDQRAIAIAKTGGLLGVGFFQPAICEETVSAIVDSIQYGIQLVGEEHITLGSDYDGSVSVPMDISRLELITDELLRRNVSRSVIAKVMGGNVLRVFREHLPSE